MAHRLLVALALAQASQAFLDDFVEVSVVKTEVFTFVPPQNLEAEVIGAQQQQTNNPGLTACSVANAVFSNCDNRGVLEATAPVASVRDCLCCFSSTALYPIYSSCASYVSNALPAQSTIYSAMSELWDACSALGTGLCARGAAASPTLIGGGGPIATTTTTRVISTTAPPACTSVAVLLRSCSSKMGAAFSTARDYVVASCLCADAAGDPNTSIEDYASSCAPFAKTAATQDYDLVSILQTFCDANPLHSTPTSGAGGGIVFTPIVATGTNGLGGISLTPTASGGGGESASTGTNAGANGPATTSSRPGDGNSASGVVVPGVIAWAAAVVVSFLYAI
ncbi:hypothetical protein QBC43DRAFT_320151 [Cladorrhinum sp. PSN259]|nr:hypothetical protein QBC43DRAFT_320151 [Cladorrhinum sp. PSN259]